MKKIKLLLIFLASIMFMSCATAIVADKNIEKYQIQLEQCSKNMDFIGYKIDTNILSTTTSTQISSNVYIPDIIMSEFDQAKAIANTDSLRQLGYNLENIGIADNKADSYFGIYSLQEMELYNSNNRYVTFIEVAKNQLNYTDNKGSKNFFGGFGGGLILGGTTMLIAGAACANDKYLSDLGNTYVAFGTICSIIGLPIVLSAATPTKTKIQFEGLYNIYLYDTETKSLIRKEPVSVSYNETFKGSYTYDNSSKQIVWNYISDTVYNSLMKKYEEISKWLTNRE